MDVEELKSLIRGLEQFAEVIEQINTPPAEKIQLKGVMGSFKSMFISELFPQNKKNLVFLLNDKEEAAYFFDDLNNLGLENETLFFPSSYKRSVQYGQREQENIVLRAETLNKFSQPSLNHILVTYPEAVIEKVISKKNLEKSTLQIKKGDNLSIAFLNEFLYEYGFERVDFVYEPGQFSIRGGIVDIFSFSNEDPYRIDFFGDDIETIRSFNIDDQISKKTFESVTILPNIQDSTNEDEKISIFEFIPENAVYFGNDLKLFFDQVELIYKGTLEGEKKYISEEVHPEPSQLINGKGLSAKLEGKTVIEFNSSPFFTPDRTIVFNQSVQPVFNKNFQLLGENLQKFKKDKYGLFILSNNEKQIERLKVIFRDTDMKVNFNALLFTLHSGFIDHDLKICCYTDHQIFERYHRFNLKSRKAQRESITLKELNKLHPGDYVVHVDHGIGKFAGLVKTEVNGKQQEAIRLIYKDQDSLLVSIHSLHRISKFKGKDGTEPKMNKLGTAAWQKMKSRAKARVKDIAKELIALYSKRRAEKGFAFSPDSYLQTELEASFIYEDTPDQEKATNAIKEDMQNAMPMDRLVCGDVGFGKTEVAIRAAFKAVADSKQVAVLVPTTILALQHFKTFSERLSEFPAKISYISRLRTSAEIRQTLKDLKEGKVDIIIGTHRLVSKDVEFKNLGLLVVDEEQKFGVSVKEKLKQLKLNVDTLTLTATPIPRTLQFSLMGARDLSIINTPPPNRFPIVTELHGFNEQIIKEAITYEVDRGGQVFFIHNRIQNIYEVEGIIKRITPGIRTIVGHGRMDGQQLEKVMLDFINGDYDVLVATTIIESGLDIPNANTIIINQAQNFGLSDLHQLRGRVGRSNKRAFCYLLAPPLSTLSPESRRRLKAIEEFSDLGSGFNIAMRDLDIRGAGNLLGGEQSGFIADIGFETYHRILNEAVQELKQEEFSDLYKDNEDSSGVFLNLKFVNDCIIDTDLELLFPDAYIPSVSERMLLYRELDDIDKEEALIKYIEALKDRFGPIPEQTSELIEVMRLKWLAIDLGLEKITLKHKKMICYFISDQKSAFYKTPVFEKVLYFIQTNQKLCRMKEGNNKLTLTFENIRNISSAKNILEKILAT